MLVLEVEVDDHAPRRARTEVHRFVAALGLDPDIPTLTVSEAVTVAVVRNHRDGLGGRVRVFADVGEDVLTLLVEDDAGRLLPVVGDGAEAALCLPTIAAAADELHVDAHPGGSRLVMRFAVDAPDAR